MIRRMAATLPCVVLLVFGCSPPVNSPVLQPGDVGRPEVVFAPNAPWSEGVEVCIGMLARIDRPSGSRYYLLDKDISLERVEMSGRLTFFRDEQLIGEPHELPFVHDC